LFSAKDCVILQARIRTQGDIFMALNQQFRTAFRGFNREDVVHYIEYLNNYYNTQLQQLNAQLQSAQANDNTELLARLEAAETRCAQLEAELAEAQAAPAPISATEEELEAYRRAEKAERLAQERASQIYTQANAVLAEVTLKAETASAQVAAAADQVTAKLQGTKAAFDEAVAALYAIRPEV
jgi:tRNA U34 5-methylaminomethyl-2-thiouridine-forming methyltransferase MnmC